MSMIAKGGAEWVERPRDLSPSQWATLIHAAGLLERAATTQRAWHDNERDAKNDLIATARALLTRDYRQGYELPYRG